MKNSAVRIGIEAPEDVNVVRSEIADKFVNASAIGSSADKNISYSAAKPSRQKQPVLPATLDRRQSKIVQRQLDAANLAIHLAQNQLVQGLQHNAEEALEQALTCLKQLEETLQNTDAIQTSESLVKEPTDRYLKGSDTVGADSSGADSIEAISGPAVLVLHPANPLATDPFAEQPWSKAVRQLEKEGFGVEFANDISEAIEYLLRREYPIALFSITDQPEVSFDSLGRFLACRGTITPAISVDREFETFGAGTEAYAGVFANAACANWFRETTLAVE